MREIRFRAWDKRNKKMLSVPTLYFDDTDYTASTIRERNNFLSIGEESELMQYTGLKDKDGKEIYEGDIVDHYATYGTVIFEDGMFSLSTSAKVNFGFRQPLCYIHTTECEIIGNIYETPELIEGGQTK